MAHNPNDHRRAKQADGDLADYGAAKVYAASGADFGFSPDDFMATWTFAQNHTWMVGDGVFYHPAAGNPKGDESGVCAR